MQELLLKFMTKFIYFDTYTFEERIEHICGICIFLYQELTRSFGKLDLYANYYNML